MKCEVKFDVQRGVPFYLETALQRCVKTSACSSSDFFLIKSFQYVKYPHNKQQGSSSSLRRDLFNTFTSFIVTLLLCLLGHASPVCPVLQFCAVPIFTIFASVVIVMPTGIGNLFSAIFLSWCLSSLRAPYRRQNFIHEWDYGEIWIFARSKISLAYFWLICIWSSKAPGHAWWALIASSSVISEGQGQTRAIKN